MAARRLCFHLAAGALTIALSACGTRQAPPPPPAPAPAVHVPAPQPLSADEYFKTESSRSLLVVMASELAAKRSSDGRVRQIASQLKTDHTGIAAQLNLAGRRLNLLPSASLLAPDQVQFDGLQRTADFDIAYLRMMKSAIENCGRAHGAYAERGGSPTLRPVARFAASICADEMRLFR